jgi:hypothetical protein
VIFPFPFLLSVIPLQFAVPSILHEYVTPFPSVLKSLKENWTTETWTDLQHSKSRGEDEFEFKNSLLYNVSENWHLSEELLNLPPEWTGE